MASRPSRLRVNTKAAAQLAVTCVSHKVTYQTEADARAGVEKAMDAGDVRPGCHLQPYRCQECGHWHLANKRVVFREEEKP